jgi:hypothetical protein
MTIESVVELPGRIVTNDGCDTMETGTQTVLSASTTSVLA